MILIAVLIVACVLLAVLGFVAPRFSRRPQGGLDRRLDHADGAAKEHGGVVGKLGHGAASTSHKAVDKATDAGRSAREKT